MEPGFENECYYQGSHVCEKAVTYCTTCDNTNPPSNCTPREKQAVAVNPGRDLPNILQGGVLGEKATPPEVSVLEAQRANITILPGGIMQEGNTRSNDNGNGILGMEQSDVVSDNEENETGTVNDGEEEDESKTTEEGEEEQDERGPSKEQASKRTDESG